MGEVLAWIIGWDLILEYGVSFAAVSVGGGAYLVELLDSLFGVTISESICLPLGEGGLRRRQLLGLRPERVQRDRGGGGTDLLRLRCPPGARRRSGRSATYRSRSWGRS
jgi:hypothetical protein